MPRALTSNEIQAFRDSLCDVATRLFAERGFEGVTLRALAAELGCSPMTPYRYFANREEIFEAVRDRAFQRLSDRCMKVEATIACPLERLRALGRTYVRFGAEEPHAYLIMFQTGGPVVEGQEPVVDTPMPSLESGWTVLVRTTTDAVERGAMEGDPVTLAHVAWTAMHGLISLHLSDRLRFDRDLEELLEPVLENLIRGARPKD